MNKMLIAAVSALLMSGPALAESLVSLHSTPRGANFESPLVIGLGALLAVAVAYRMLRNYKSKQQ